MDSGISGLVVEYIVAIDVTRVRFPADAFTSSLSDTESSDVRWGNITHVIGTEMFAKRSRG